MFKVSHFFIKIATIAIALMYLVLAIYLAAGFYFMSRLPDYKADIEAFLNNKTGLVWKVENLQGHLQRYNPVFHVESLQVYTDAKNAKTPIKLNHAQIQVNLLATLFNRQVIVKELRADNFSLRLAKKNNAWSIEGVQQSGSSIYQVSDFEVLLEGLHSVNIDSIDINLNDGEREITLPEMILELRSSRKNRQLIFKNKLHNEQNFELTVDFDKLSLSKDSIFSAYMQAENFSSSDWLAWLVKDWSFEDFNGELWLEKQYNQGVDFIASVDKGAVVRQSSDSWQLSGIQSEFAGHINLQGDIDLWWQFGKAQWNNREIILPAANLSLHREAGRLTHIVLQAKTIDVAYLNEMLLSSNILFANLADIMSTLNPSGLLDDLYLYLPIEHKPEQLKLRANLKGVSVSPWKNVPGGENINGYIESSLVSGFVELSSDENFSLEFPKVYKQRLEFDSIRGRVDWSANNGFKVAAKDIRATLQDEKIFASFYIEGGPEKSQLPGYMSLNIGAKNTHAETLLKYVPKTLNTKLLAWINNGKLSGGIDEGGFVYNGPLRKGYAEQKNVLLYLNLADTNLYFDPSWPRLKSVQGLLTVDNNQAKALIDKASFSDLDIDNALVNVDFSKNNQVLTLSSDVHGRFDDALSVLKSPALQNTVGSAINDWHSTAGTISQGKFNLTLPLSKSSHEKLNIEFTSLINAADLLLNNMDLSLSKLSGPISYSTQKGLTAKKITGEIWGEPFDIRLGDFSSNKFNIDVASASSALRVDINGQVLLEDIAKWLNLPVLGYLQGSSAFYTQINIIDKQTQIAVQSDLAGATFLLPDTIKDKFDKNKQFRMDWFINQSVQPMRLTISDFVDAEFYFDQFSFVGGKVDLGLPATRDVASLEQRKLWLEKNSGRIVIEGALDQLALDSALHIIDQYDAYSEQFEQKDKNAAPVQLWIDHFEIKKGLAFGQTFKQIDLSMESQSESFQFFLHSDNLIGSIALPRASRSKQDSIIEDSMQFQRPYEIDLSFLKIDVAKENTTASDFSQLLPTELPALSAEIERLEFNDKALQAVSFNSFVKDKAFIVSDFSAQLQDMLITSQENALQWSLNSAGEQFSEVNLQLAGNNIESFLDSLLSSPDDETIKSPLKSETTFLDFSFVWQGVPAAFSIDELNGQMQFNLEKGQFLNSPNSTNNVLKLIGLVNFDTLFRRFQLDFSDLYSEGLAFDQAEGRLQFSQNKVSFKEFPIHVKGPSSEFFLSGVADLEASTIDADLKITLPVAKSLPWIVALTGGLPAAVGTFVATKLFENEMNKLSTAMYKVSGSLDEPELVFDKLFQTNDESAVAEQEAAAEENANELDIEGVVEEADINQPE